LSTRPTAFCESNLFYSLFIHSIQSLRLAVPDLSPNVGLFWYFFIEMFDVFRTFFLVLLQAHVFVYALPVTWKFWYPFLFIQL